MTGEYYRTELEALYHQAKKDHETGLAFHLLQEIRDSKEPEKSPK